MGSDLVLVWFGLILGVVSSLGYGCFKVWHMVLKIMDLCWHTDGLVSKLFSMCRFDLIGLRLVKQARNGLVLEQFAFPMVMSYDFSA